MVGAEMPMTSDQVIWSEQNRLHISYDNCTSGGANVTGTNVIAPVAGFPGVQNVVSVNDTVLLLDTVTGAEEKAIVTASVAAPVAAVATEQLLLLGLFWCLAGTAANFTAGAALTSGSIKVFVYGSSYGKGTSTG